MAQRKESIGFYTRGIILLIITIAAVFLIFKNLDVFGNVLLVGLGFGAVIMIHEFGHFIVARMSGIKIDTFAIGFPPVLFGLRKTARGWKVRVLPKFFPKENDPTGEGALGFCIGSPENPSETEYRIGLVPFGGYVKMLGQEDVGTVEATTDPRSFVNKSLLTRCAVVAAGVFFNAVSAILFFMIAFMIGVKLPAPIIGDVLPDSPAAKAGLKPGDRVLSVNGDTDIDFSNIMLAAALSDVNEKVSLKVRHLEGNEEMIALSAAKLPNSPPQIPRGFGIMQGQSLTLGKIKDPNAESYKLGFKPGDTIVAVNETPIKASHELYAAIENSLEKNASVTVERKTDDQTQTLNINVPLEMHFALTMDGSNKNLANIVSMVPRMKVASVPQKSKLQSFLGTGKTTPNLRVDDVIVGIGSVNEPTYSELRQTVKAHAGKMLELRVLRTSDKGQTEQLALETYPKQLDSKDPNSTVIGIELMPAIDQPYIAKTIETNDMVALAIPEGSKITAVAEKSVSDWRQIIAELKANAGKNISIAFETKGAADKVRLKVPAQPDFALAKSTFAVVMPFKDLRETYKAENPVMAIKMGYDKTAMFIAQTYVTLKGLFVGLISPKALMGPAGILKVSYMIVSERMWTFYIYFIGLISASIAVMNFLPFPILDGGVILMMLIEKIKGSPINPKVAGYISYIGLVLIAAFFLYVTWNDLTNVFFK